MAFKGFSLSGKDGEGIGRPLLVFRIGDVVHRGARIRARSRAATSRMRHLRADRHHTQRREVSLSPADDEADLVGEQFVVIPGGELGTQFGRQQLAAET